MSKNARFRSALVNGAVCQFTVTGSAELCRAELSEGPVNISYSQCVPYIRNAAMIRPDEYVGDSHFLRDGRAIPVDDAGRLVALALGAAVAGAGGVDHRDASSPVTTFRTCSMLRGNCGSG